MKHNSTASLDNATASELFTTEMLMRNATEWNDTKMEHHSQMEAGVRFTYS